jgi:hypothetical protein
VLAVVVVNDIVDARTSAHWRQVAAERRRASESASVRSPLPRSARLNRAIAAII